MKLGWVAALLFVATVLAANWALQTFGVVTIFPGLQAPAGVFFVGVALILRDVVQETLGRLAVVACILAGAGLSYWVSDAVSIPGGHASIAVASGAAFLLSELADFAVYTPLRERTLAGGIVASQVAGAVVDSALFLWLAFGSLALFWGQFVGKTLIVIPALALLPLWKRTLLSPSSRAEASA